MTRTRKLIIAIATGVTVVAVGGGVAIAVAQQDPGPPDLDRAAQVARDAAGDGEVVGVEQDDDGTYEIEVRRADGSEADIDLSPSFDVTRTEEERDDDSDELPLDDATRSRAADAALASVDEGVVVSVEADLGGYDVEIRHPDRTESEVRLDTDFTVVYTEREHDD